MKAPMPVPEFDRSSRTSWSEFAARVRLRAWPSLPILAMLAISLALALLLHPSGGAAAGAELNAGLPDLVVIDITAAQLPAGCPPAGAVQVIIKNQGTGPAQGFFTSLSGGSAACEPWRVEFLAAGETFGFSCAVDAPSTAFYTAIVDSDSSVAESDEDNNELRGEVTIALPPTCGATPTATATPTQTPTAVPTGSLGPLTLHGRVTDNSNGAPIPQAVVSGEIRGNTIRPLPIATTDPDGFYELDTAEVLDTDTFSLDFSASDYEGAHLERSALSVYFGVPIDVALARVQPTPTPTPLGAIYLHITVDLQGRPPAPDIAWETPLSVTLSTGGSIVFSGMITCDAEGAFEVGQLEEQAYSVRVKGLNTLVNVAQTAALEPGPNLLHMGTLLAGDTTGDDRIDILDFSLFRLLYNSADPRADLNNSGGVDILDFSLLRSNFGQRGPIQLVEAP